MTNTIDCPNCGKTVPALNNSGHRRTYCTIECSAAYRPKLAAQRRERQRIVHEYNVRSEARFQAERQKRLARLERMPAS